MGCGEGRWGRAVTDATPAAFYLGLCRLRGILSPPSATTTFRRRAVLLAGTMVLQAELIYFAATKIRIGRGNVAATTSQAGHSFLRHDGAAAILDFKPRIGNHCSTTYHFGDFRAAILDFRPRIGNHCSTTGHFGDFRAAILDFKPRIENRCSQKSKQGQSAHRFSI